MGVKCSVGNIVNNDVLSFCGDCNETYHDDHFEIQ